MAINQEKKEQIINAIQQKLAEKGKNLVCPVCGNHNFILADGFTQDGLQDELIGIVIGGQSIPMVIVVCNHCGHSLRFSLGVLGLLPKNEQKKE